MRAWAGSTKDGIGPLHHGNGREFGKCTARRRACYLVLVFSQVLDGRVGLVVVVVVAVKVKLYGWVLCVDSGLRWMGMEECYRSVWLCRFCLVVKCYCSFSWSTYS